MAGAEEVPEHREGSGRLPVRIAHHISASTMARPSVPTTPLSGAIAVAICELRPSSGHEHREGNPLAYELVRDGLPSYRLLFLITNTSSALVDALQ